MIKCIKIDVENEVVSEVLINDNIQDIYKQLECDLFEVVRLDNENDLYVDEEGLLKVNKEWSWTERSKSQVVKDNIKFFSIEGYPQTLVGNGLIMSHGNMGETLSTSLTIDEVRKRVKFHNKNQFVQRELDFIQQNPHLYKEE